MATGHALDLGRHRDGYMSYNHTVLCLAFLGFTDPHTSIDKYYVTIGTSYSSNDLIEVIFSTCCL